jgi:hypothetical protein
MTTTPPPVRVEKTALHEIVFAVFLAMIVAVAEVYPRNFSDALLAGLLAVFVLNLGYFLRGRKTPPGQRCTNCYLVLNCIAIFVVVLGSGGRDSMFWVAFLLPVLSAAVSDNSSPWPFVVLNSFLIGALYLPYHDAYSAAEWAMKVGTFAFAGAVTRRGYLSERDLRERIEAKRLHLEYLAVKMLQEQRPIQADGDLRERVEKRLRLLENPLAVLQDSARLVELSAPGALSDIKRIEACHRLIKSLTQDLWDILYHDEFWIEKGSFESVYRDVLAELKYPLAVKEIKFLEAFEPDLPPIPFSRAHLQQLLHSILSRAALNAAHGDLFDVQVRIAGLGEDPYLEAVLKHPGLGDVFSLAQLQRIAERHGGWLSLDYLTQAVRYTLALPLRQGIRLEPPA